MIFPLTRLDHVSINLVFLLLLFTLHFCCCLNSFLLNKERHFSFFHSLRGWKKKSWKFRRKLFLASSQEKKIKLIKIWLTFEVIYCSENFSISGLMIYIFCQRPAEAWEEQPQRDLRVDLWGTVEIEVQKWLGEILGVEWEYEKFWKTKRQKFTAHICFKKLTTHELENCHNLTIFSHPQLTHPSIHFITINRIIFNPINLRPKSY